MAASAGIWQRATHREARHSIMRAKAARHEAGDRGEHHVIFSAGQANVDPKGKRMFLSWLLLSAIAANTHGCKQLASLASPHCSFRAQYSAS